MLLLALLALTIGSDDLAAKAEAAKQAMATREFERAIELYHELDQADPGDPAIEQNLGLALYSSGRYAESIKVFGQVLRTNPDNAPALLFSGMARNRLDEPRQAIPLLTKFLSANKNSSASASAWKDLGIAYWTLAKQNFDWIDSHAPFTAEWFSLMARTEFDKQHYQRAFQLYRTALSRDANVPGIHAGLAEVYRESGHADWAAIEDAREHRAANSTVDESRRRYLETIEDEQRAAEALDHLEKMSSGPEIHELLGFSYRAQQRDTESADEFQKALLIDPENRELKKEWATALWLSGECVQAMPILEQLLQSSPSSTQLNHVLGDCLVQEKHPQEALLYLNRALKVDPGFLPAQASIGRAYLHLNRYSQAILHLKEALALNDKATVFQLAQAYKKSGDEKTANRYLQEYKRYGSSSEMFSQLSDRVELTPP